jgi:peptide/nickel transport system ATP-binding protein
VSGPVLAINGLAVEIARQEAAAVAITRDVDLALYAGRTLALVGESGCGKSVTALAVMNLLVPPLRIAAGGIELQGENIAALPPGSAAMRAIRGRRIGMIFQDPMTALDPVYPVGEQIAEGLRLHLQLSRRAALARAVDMLGLVGIPDAAQRAAAYPFQLSGGMRQRVMIAIAIACEPEVLIADEPTTALDVTVQAQILDLLRDLSARMGMATLLITHDLGVVAENADEVAVMYRGRVVEQARVDALFAAPAHPYTRGLLASLPPVAGKRERLQPIPGQVPPAGTDDAGCGFSDRCRFVMAACRAGVPHLRRVGEGHAAACLLHEAVVS